MYTEEKMRHRKKTSHLPHRLIALISKRQYDYIKSLDGGIGENIRQMIYTHMEQAKQEEALRLAVERRRQEKEKKYHEEAEKLKPPPRGLTDKEMARVRELKEAAYRMGLLRPGALEHGRKRKMKR